MTHLQKHFRYSTLILTTTLEQGFLRMKPFSFTGAMHVAGSIAMIMISSEASAQSTDDYRYDVHGRLASIDRSDHSSTTYSYDDAGNRSAVAGINRMEARWEAEDLPHLAGFAIPGGWAASAGHGAGFMTYGPYSPTGAAGLYIASWRVKVDSPTYPDSGEVVNLDIWNATAGSSLGSRQLKRADWLSGDSYQYFEIPFAVGSASSSHQLEYRTWYSGLATVSVDAIGIRRAGQAWAMDDAGIYHNGGYAVADGWAADSHNAPAHIAYGPYAAAPAGARTAVWRLRIDDVTSPDVSPIVTLDIWDATAGQSLGAVTLERQDWEAAGHFQLFEVPFTVEPTRAGNLLEYRAFHHGVGNIVVSWVAVR